MLAGLSVEEAPAFRSIPCFSGGERCLPNAPTVLPEAPCTGGFGRGAKGEIIGAGNAGVLVCLETAQRVAISC